MNFDNLSILRLILAALTCFRLAQLIALDNGPLFIFQRLRIAVEQYIAAKEGRRQSSFWRSLADGISCPYCLGFYISLLCAIPVIFPSFWGDTFLLWLGIMGLQAFMQGLVDGEDVRK